MIVEGSILNRQMPVRVSKLIPRSLTWMHYRLGTCQICSAQWDLELAA